jgi:hypothetical protein
MDRRDRSVRIAHLSDNAPGGRHGMSRRKQMRLYERLRRNGRRLLRGVIFGLGGLPRRLSATATSVSVFDPRRGDLLFERWQQLQVGERLRRHRERLLLRLWLVDRLRHVRVDVPEHQAGERDRVQDAHRYDAVQLSLGRLHELLLLRRGLPLGVPYSELRWRWWHPAALDRRGLQLLVADPDPGTLECNDRLKTFSPPPSSGVYSRRRMRPSSGLSRTSSVNSSVSIESQVEITVFRRR